MRIESSMTVIKCTCESQYCDEKYGEGKRTANPMRKEGMYRCAVCGGAGVVSEPWSVERLREFSEIVNSPQWRKPVIGKAPPAASRF